LKAERFLKQALALRVQYHGLEDHDVASNLMSLGDFYFIQGRLDMALRSYQEVLRIQMVLKEDNLLFTTMTWYNLAVAQYRMGHYDHARESAARALMLRMKHVENVDSIGHNMASILYVFGMAQSSLGEYDDARKNFNRALVIRKKLFLQDHLLILNVMKAMGIVSFNEENWDEAISMFLQVYRKRSWRLGFEHPVSLEALYFLALVVRDKGEDSTVAFEMLNVVIECLCKHVGDEDTKVVDAMCALAESYRKCRMWDHALMIIKQALKVCEQNVGKQHVMYANVMRGLGEIQLEQGDMDGALRSFQHVIQIFMLPDNAVTVTVLQTSDVWQRIAKAYFQKAEYHFSSQAYIEVHSLIFDFILTIFLTNVTATHISFSFVEYQV
jgi:tetratricopeptide (TPR) repeat protein